MEIDKIINKLKEDEMKNINMINFIKDYPIEDMKIIGNSILIKGKSDHSWNYISSSSKEEFKKLNKYFEGEKYFAVVEDWMVPIILKNKELDWKLSCKKLYFPRENNLPNEYYKAENLSLKDAEYIYKNSKYKDFTSEDYIKERIKKGNGLGIYKDRLIAWILSHDDGAIGFINVLDEYRNKGLAMDLTISMIKKLRELNKIPFVHIEEDNIKSMNLAKKVGFIDDRFVHWIKLK
ncbi:MAG: GNAT family N-acetyltransferase [Firmicutes bacterium]|nr:GNAT family N-acetyltransferase [Bacillota bacterium]